MSSVSISGFLVLALPVLCLGQNQPLTVDDCIRLAQSAPSAITSARRDVDIAKLGLNQAQRAYLPTGALLTGYNYNTPSASNPSTFAYVSLNAIHEYIGHGQITIPFDISGRLKAGVDRARADQDVASAGLAIASRDLRRIVTVAYYQVLLSRRLTTVASEVLQEAQSFEQRVQLLQQGGEAARADVVQASAQVAFYQQALLNAQLQAELANQDLASFWTTDVNTRLELVDPFDAPPPLAEIGGAGPTPYLNRPEFSLFDAQRRGFAADARATRAQLKPQTNVVLQYGVDMNRLNFRERGSAVFLGVTVPVFDWFRTRDAAQQFSFRAEQAQNQARVAERTYSRDYQNALSRLNSQYRQVAIAQQQIDVASENLRLSRIKYQGGEGVALEVLTAQTQVGQARGNHLTALANYYVAMADLEVASGR